jgi:hypothetical protein
MFLKEHADVREKVEAKLMPLLGLKPPEAPTGGTAASAGVGAQKGAAPAAPATRRR